MKKKTIKSGLPGLDRLLHGLLPGDNVVLKVGSIEDYRRFVEPFCQASLEQRIPLIYFRFARHKALISPETGVDIHELKPESGFEPFISHILDIIEEKGPGANYVFDCLSDLAADWYSERMLGNFFMLACPYLYQLDTVAYFALIRDRHSPLAVHAIANTAQVVLDIHHNQHSVFVHPLKVEGRFSRNMYALHRWRQASGEFKPVRNSATMSRILGENTQTWLEFTIQRPDVWTESILAAKAAVAGDDNDNQDCRQLHDRLVRMALTRETHFGEMVRQYLPLAELLKIIRRMVGTGLIGGKSLGMLLARAILVHNDGKWKSRLEEHDSFFVGSDVFYTFLVLNQCWWPRRRRKGEKLDQYLQRAQSVREKIMAGTFPNDIMEQFEEMLNYFGQSPIIVRSSSLQEDNYGNAFSGKYESVFCASQGSPQQRMNEFLNAVRTVYASVMSQEALLYRQSRGLLESEEQMALLVQRVSGGFENRYFFPVLAGTGFSFNPYAWGTGIKPEAGMLRLVLGLGTRAVDRTEDDYTRLVALNAPWLRPPAEEQDHGAYAQKRVDAVDLQKNQFATIPLAMALPELSEPLADKLTSPDQQMTRRAREHGVTMEIPRILDFDGLLQGELPDYFREILASLQKAYRHPVDIEFTVNFAEPGETPLINLVQCRPFQVKTDRAGNFAKPPENLTESQVLLRSAGPIIGRGMAAEIERIIYVVPRSYSKLSEQDRYAVARLIGRLTTHSSRPAPTIMLVGPGRWGTRSPSLGVPVNFSEIKNVTVLAEIAAMHEGLIPDLSLGTHFFNDMVEADMLYLAVFPERRSNLVNEQVLLSLPNQLGKILPREQRWRETILVLDGRLHSPPTTLHLHADPASQQAVCWQQA